MKSLVALLVISSISISLPRFVRDYCPQKWENCPIKMPMAITMKAPQSNIGNKILFSVLITVSEEVPGDIEFVIESNRCTLDMKTCEKYPVMNVREMCKKFQEKNAFFSMTLASFKPPLKCPIKTGNYSLEESFIDLTPVAFVPLDGFVWIVTFKLVANEKGSKNKKTVLCMNSETKIIKVNKRT